MLSIELLKASSYPQKVGITCTHISKVVDKRQKISPASVYNLSPWILFWG
jgi:hypothetical protein